MYRWKGESAFSRGEVSVVGLLCKDQTYKTQCVEPGVLSAALERTGVPRQREGLRLCPPGSPAHCLPYSCRLLLLARLALQQEVPSGDGIQS